MEGIVRSAGGGVGSWRRAAPLLHAHDLLDVHVRPVDDTVVHIGGRGHHIVHTHRNSFY